MPRDRVYTDDEIRALLRRATEIGGPSGNADEPGLSLREIEQVARESGIDPEAVRRAAKELALEDQRSTQDKRYPFLGASPVIDRERIVPGNMAHVDWDEAVGICRRAFGGDGKSLYAGNTREWVLNELGSERARVVISPRDDGTSIRVIRDIADLAWASHGGIAGGMIGVSVILVFAVGLSLPVSLAASAVSIGVLYMIARSLFRYLAWRQDEHAKDLLDELESLIPVPNPSDTRISNTAADKTANETIDQPVIRTEAPDERRTDDSGPSPTRRRQRP